MTREPHPVAPSAAPCEQEVHAEHRAALDATVFGGAAHAGSIVLELREGSLRRVDVEGPDA